MYIGRFAPSPTGPLHFGSLVAAVASYCDAKAHHGKWLVRMEDLDKPREMPGAADDILRTLEDFGFEWDGDIIYQSQRNEAYMNAFNILKDQQLIYPCTCTRKEIADSALSSGIEGAVYAGTCLKQAIKLNAPIAWRIKTEDILIQFNDAIQGCVSQHLKFDIGDFVIKRADGLFAYQLAVVVDDAEQEVTDVVRGADLLNSTPRQIYLQNLLAMDNPNYTHVPVATNAQGEKLSKQTLAQPLNASRANIEVFEALSFLGQNPPASIKNASLDEVWRWAKESWVLNNAFETK